jgi:hypothetical protein
MGKSVTDGDLVEVVVEQSRKIALTVILWELKPPLTVKVSPFPVAVEQERKMTSWDWDHFTRIDDKTTCMESESQKG